jgi:hypothetical protein
LHTLGKSYSTLCHKRNLIMKIITSAMYWGITYKLGVTATPPFSKIFRFRFFKHGENVLIQALNENVYGKIKHLNVYESQIAPCILKVWFNQIPSPAHQPHSNAVGSIAFSLYLMEPVAAMGVTYVDELGLSNPNTASTLALFMPMKFFQTTSIPQCFTPLWSDIVSP